MKLDLEYPLFTVQELVLVPLNHLVWLNLYLVIDLVIELYHLQAVIMQVLTHVLLGRLCTLREESFN